MKHVFIAFYFLSSLLSAQDSLATKLQNTYAFNAERLVSVDNFETYYYTTKNTAFVKKTRDTLFTYSNVQLGMPSTANVFNPLKINLFYKDFNTVIVLDNRLAEVFKIDFNTIADYKNVAFISTGFDNTIWVFNLDTQQLELFNYKTQTTSIRTVPIQEQPLDMQSDYNSVWLLTEKHLYIYNYFGSLIAKIKNDGYESFYLDHGNAVFKKGKTLYFLPKNAEETRPLNDLELLINQFSLTDETLYICADEKLHQFHLKIN